MKLINTMLFLLAGTALQAQVITSPNGQLKVNVSCDNGVANYSVVLDSDTLICKSPLGLRTTIGDYTKGLKLTGMSEIKSVSENYSLPQSKIADISYTANEATYSFATDAERSVPAFDVTMHVDDSNVAFKYTIHSVRARGGERLSCIVEEENTIYNFPEGTTSFNCPQMLPQGGFARTTPSYETFYEYDAPLGKNGSGLGYVFPALFKIGDKGWVMLNETNVGGNYCGSRIDCAGDRAYTIAYPDEREFGGVGQANPGLSLPGDTPWRTITVGRTMAPLAETTIQWDLVKPQYEASIDYKYGRSAWSWIIRMDDSCNYDEQKEYIDFAAEMGWEYLLIDAWWDRNIGYEKIEELSKYAQSKGVGLFLWYNSNGYWNDAPQGPRGKLHRLMDRRREMAWLQKAGIKGLKIDFIGGDKQQCMQMYEDILFDANEFGLMVIFHGCTLPRGWERMYPNFAAAEAVRASENLSFGQNDNDLEAKAGTMHPVLRNAVANMDFGGSALNKRYSKGNDRGTYRRTSDVYALATAVLFQSPIQNFALAPNNLTDAPEWAIDFMKKVPTTWEDMKYIDGYPGKYLIMARKHAGKWILAAINAEEKPLELQYNVNDLFSGNEPVTVYSDTPELVGGVKTVKANKKGIIKLSVPCNGGLVVMQ